MAGYTRQASSNIADGQPISAQDFNDEFNAIQTAFGKIGGHSHDPSDSDGGAPIEKVGPASEVEVTSVGILPKSSDAYNIGSTSLKFQKLFLGASGVELRDATINIFSSADGQLDIDADGELEVVAPTIDLQASTAITLVSDAITLGESGASDVVVNFAGDTNTGVLTWMEDEDYFKFDDDVLISGTEKLYFNDAGGEYISGDTTDLTINSGGDINLTATSDVNIPANVGLTFASDNADKIESNDTDLSISSGGDINLTATTDVNIPQNVGLSFSTDDAEKIESDGTDLTINSGGDINLTATSDVNIPSNVGITFGDDGEKIEGDGTNLAINSSGDLNVTATTVDINATVEVDGNLNLDSDNSVLAFGANQEVTITHVPDTGLNIKEDAGPVVLDLQTGSQAVGSGDTLAQIDFTAPSELSGGFSTATAASIVAEAEETFGANTHNTAIVFKTANTAGALERMRIKGNGQIDFNENSLINVGDISLDSISSDGNSITLNLDDNILGAFEVKEGANSYIKVDTGNGFELITFGKNSTFTGTTISDLGTVTTADIDGGTIDGVTIGTTSAITSFVASSVDIDGGAIDGTTIGGTTPAAGTFTNVTANGTVDFTGATVSADTVDIDGGAIDGVTLGATTAITSLVATTADINGGSIDGVTIGTTNPATELKVDNIRINGNTIEATNLNGNITLTPNGDGAVVISGINYPTGDGSAGQLLSTDGAGNLSFVAGASFVTELQDDASPVLGADLDVNGNAITTSVANGSITLTPLGSGSVVLGGLTFPNTDGTAGQLLKTDGLGNLSFVDAASFTTEVSEDTTPVLGGNLDANTNNITGATTVETTSIEVTNIKANDGTVAGSIANTSGVVTLASSVLTTADINGGTIDSVAIGETTASTGKFTSVGTSTINASDGTGAISIADATGIVSVVGTELSANRLNIDNIVIDGNDIISSDENGNINITPNGAGNIVLDGLTFPNADGNNGQLLSTNGSGTLSFVNAPTFTTELADDTSPVLGGDLDLNGNLITNTNTTTTDITLDATGNINLDHSSTGIKFLESGGTYSIFSQLTGNDLKITTGSSSPTELELKNSGVLELIRPGGGTMKLTTNYQGSSNGELYCGYVMDVKIGATVSMQIGSSSVSITGSLSKGSGSFNIPHPLASKAATHRLVHSFLEGPQADLIYRGTVALVAGTATVNIDTAAGMTEGTFVALCRDVQCFTSNESGWTAIKGSVSGNLLTITAQDNTCTDTISWMVVGERQDQHMYDTEWTDENGKVIVEPLIPVEEDE